MEERSIEDVVSSLRMDMMTILMIKRKHLTLNEEEYEE
jgi:hypothetical protein